MVTSPAEQDCAENHPPVIDPAALLERCMGDAGAAVMLLGMFRDRLPSILVQIRSGLADLSDVPTLTRMVHTLKGNAGNLAAQRLYHAAHRLEQALKEQRFADTACHLAAIEREAASLLKQIPVVVDSLT
jgi:HPt (histidine-containing phosphotransfer) domain-containing protein